MTRQTSKQPNVLIFFTDQQRWDSTGVHGNPLGLTPNFDGMARHGTHVFNSFTCQPVCAPARASLQTGLYAKQAGVFHNALALPRDKKTLAHRFREAGYQTGYIGKWHLAGLEDPVPEAQRGGYEYWLASNLLEFTSKPYETIVYNNDNEPVLLPGYRVDALADAAISYIESHRETPFFLFLSLLEPHHQNDIDDYVAPEGYRERYTDQWVPPDLQALRGSTSEHLGSYWGIVRRLDEALGRVLDTLDSLGLTENTIVLFTSDHGCHFKTRNWEYKRSCHEGSIRTPTAIRGPGFDGGGQIQQLVSLVDLPPTLLEAAGLPIPAEMQGRSILSLLKGQTEGWPEEVYIQISESQVGRAIRTERWKYGVIAWDKEPFFDPVSETYSEAFLYDLETDPYELTNLIESDSHRHVAEGLRERLVRRMVETGEEAPVIEPPRGEVST